MKQAKRLLALLLALTLCAALFPAALAEDAGTIAPAEEPAEEPEEGVIAPAADPDALTAPEDEPQEVYSGSCGDDLTWTLTDDGTLTISGTGDMTDWSSTSDVPWYSIRSSISSVVIESGATSIGKNAFRNCTKMESISIPNTVAAINGSVFADCTSLTSIRIPGSVQSFGSSLFTRCRALETVRLEYGIPEIGSYMFSSCESLQNIWLPESITKIGSNAFQSCISLNNITIPAAVTSIGSNAFQDCTALTSVTFAGPAPTINSSAFTNVTATAYYPAGDATWTSDKLQNYGGSLTWVGLYGLRVDRTEVTDENKADILGNGIFSFDGDHTLTIHGDYSTDDSQPIIDNYGLEGLEIHTETAATLSAESAEPVIRLAKDTTFTGEGLTVFGEFTRGEAISADSTATVTVRNTKLTADCAYGYNEDQLTVDQVLMGGCWVIDNARLSVSSNPYYWTMDVDSITLQNCYITEPEGGRISDDGRMIVDANGNRTNYVLIEPNLTGYYLIGPDGWTDANLDEGNKFRKNQASLSKYMLQTSLSVNDPIKVVKADHGVITAWYPDGFGNEYVVDAVHAGDVTITFCETYQNDWASFGGYFHVLHDFGIKADGQSVTSDNMTDVLGDGIFSFDGNRTFTVNGSFKAGCEGVFVGSSLVPAFYRQHSLIENHTCDDLMIVFGQMASLSGYSLNDNNGNADFEPAPGFLFSANTTLTGAGMTVSWDTRIYGGTAGLELVPSRSTIQVDSGAKLTVLDTVLTDASDEGSVVRSIEGSDGAQLVIDHSTVTVNNGISGFAGGIELIGCAIVEPAGGRISDDGASIVNADGTPAAHVVIEPVASSAGQCGDELYWSFDSDSGKLTISGTGDMWDFTVETVRWADYRSQIVSVEIPEGVTGIGDYAFTQCAFSSVTIPDSVTRIGGGAFANCLRLESVTIPAGVTSIGKQAFYNCLWLSAFFVDEASASYSAADGILFNKDGTTLIVAPIAHEYSHYAIPAGVERIEDFAFANCGDMDGVEFPASLTEIGQAAFWSCGNLTSVCFPQNLSTIGTVAFSGCTALAEIRFLGHAPTFGTQPFNSVRANAYYPAADETWTEEVRQNYGGTLTWLPFDFYLPDGYYLIGPDGWEVVNVDPNEKFVLNIAIAEYVLTTTLTAGDPVKVVEVEDSAITTWYPDGLGNEYVVDAAHAGTVNIYFKPTYSSAWADFGGYIWIEKAAAVKYGLRINGDEVTEDHLTDTANGCWSFDGNHTLSILGDIDGSFDDLNGPMGPDVVENYGLNGLVIDFTDHAKLEPSSHASATMPRAIAAYQDTEITGAGGGECVSAWDTAIAVRSGATLTIRDTDLKVTSEGDGILGYNSDTEDARLVVDHASLEVTAGTNGSAITGFTGGIELIDCKIVEPAGGHISADGASIVKADGSVASHVVIEPTAVKYGLRINGVEVTEDHLTDTPYSRWSFDADHTLSILDDIEGEDFEYWNGPVVDHCTFEIIENYGVDGLVVDFVNHAKLTTFYSSRFYDFPAAINASKDTVITGAGGGECLANGSGSYEGPGISVKNGATLTIRETELTVKSDYNAAILGEGSGTKLVVNNASLDAVGKTGSNAIQGFTGGIELIGCEIVYPEGGRISDDGASIVNADGSVASHVVIEPVKPVNPFTDVAEGKYYYIPVLWAYYHDPQITGGTSKTTFSPNKTCTREQIVTFLWKACGAPEPETTTNPFTDVPESKYYYKAVLWAVENEITGGVSETLFGVGRPCTREQAVTFLWKACGAPEPETTTNPFTDVPESKYYYNAVMWAVQNGVTGGMSETLFGVGKTCTRGQIVTFLYAARGFLKT